MPEPCRQTWCIDQALLFLWKSFMPSESDVETLANLLNDAYLRGLREGRFGEPSPVEVSPAQPAAPRHDVESDLGQEGGPTKSQPEAPGEVGGSAPLPPPPRAS